MRYGRVLTLSLYLTGIAGCGGGSGGGSDGRSPPPPVISIDIGQAPSASEGEPSRSAMATLRWGISSTDSTQQGVSYSIGVSQDAVSVSPCRAQKLYQNHSIVNNAMLHTLLIGITDGIFR